MDRRRIQSVDRDARVGQTTGQPVAHDVQRLCGRLAAPCGLPRDAAIDHHSHTAALAAPGQTRDDRVLEQPTRLGHRPQVMRERSEEHTSELQSLMRTSYAVFCLKKTNFQWNYAITYHTPTHLH